MFNFKKRVYLDYASLAPIDSRVLAEMHKYYGHAYTNASAWHKEGVSAKNALYDARKKIADIIHSHKDEIVFTSGGTEANNIAILGTVQYLIENQNKDYKDIHIIVSAIEHSSVLETARYLAKRGVSVDYLSVDKGGVVLLDQFKALLKPNTAIVSIMTVNNETGVIQPINEIARIIRHHRSHAYPLLHTDASQASLYEEMNVAKIGADMITLDGSKMYGPRGVGLLYVKKSTPILPIIYGGWQEYGLRSGTENIPAIMGLAKAMEIAHISRSKEIARITTLRDLFITAMKSLIPDIAVNGEPAHRAPHIVNISIPQIDNELFVLRLDAKGFACSTKSACLRDVEDSHVMNAMGVNSRTSIRFSFGRWTSKRDIGRLVKNIGRIYNQKQ